MSLHNYAIFSSMQGIMKKKQLVISVVKKECYSKVKIQNFDKYFIRWCKVWGNGVGTRGAEKFLPFPRKCEIWGESLSLRTKCWLSTVYIYTGWPKIWHIFVRRITSLNTDQFSNFFHSQNQEKIWNSTITKDPNTPMSFTICNYEILVQSIVCPTNPTETYCSFSSNTVSRLIKVQFTGKRLLSEILCGSVDPPAPPKWRPWKLQMFRVGNTFNKPLQ